MGGGVSSSRCLFCLHSLLSFPRRPGGGGSGWGCPSVKAALGQKEASRWWACCKTCMGHGWGGEGVQRSAPAKRPRLDCRWADVAEQVKDATHVIEGCGPLYNARRSYVQCPCIKWLRAPFIPLLEIRAHLDAQTLRCLEFDKGIGGDKGSSCKSSPSFFF